MFNNFRELNLQLLYDILIRVLPAMICVTLHEYAHGYTAYRLGDDTAKMSGRLSLNPLRHIDFFGLIILLLAGFGWAKPVPVNMYRFKSPKRDMAITSLAGPLMNIIVAAVALLIFGLLAVPLDGSRVGYLILSIVNTTAYLSCAFAVFNLLPIPPLDGSKILFSFLPNDKYHFVLSYERYGMLILLFLVISGVISGPLSEIVYWMYNKLFFLAEFGFDISLRIF